MGYTNKVELIGHYGSDMVIAQSAWTSTSREIDEAKLSRLQPLIEMLWSKGHETPFEKATVHFLVTTDIATHIHLLKHRMSSLNAESARYKELREDKYYLPEDFKDVNVDEKHLKLNYLNNQYLCNYGEYSWHQCLAEYTELGNNLYHKCLEDLTPVLGRKRAKESARYFKTYNSQITSDVMFNMRSFANFVRLRSSEEAQVEVRELAFKMLELVESIEGNPFKITLDVWKRYRVW